MVFLFLDGRLQSPRNVALCASSGKGDGTSGVTALVLALAQALANVGIVDGQSILFVCL